MLNTKLKLIFDHVLIKSSVYIWVYLDLKQPTKKVSTKNKTIIKFLYFFVLNYCLVFFLKIYIIRYIIY